MHRDRRGKLVEDGDVEHVTLRRFDKGSRSAPVDEIDEAINSVCLRHSNGVPSDRDPLDCETTPGNSPGAPHPGVRVRL